MQDETITFRTIDNNDWNRICEIYREGINTGNATFQSEIPGWTEWDQGHLKVCRMVAIYQDDIAGWAALTPVSGRCVYAGVAEISVYVSSKYRGKSIGTKLLQELVRESEENNIWTLQAGIFPENIASIEIHKKNGFRQVGYREKIGKMNGQWRDTVLFERRSKTIGRT